MILHPRRCVGQAGEGAPGPGGFPAMGQQFAFHRFRDATACEARQDVGEILFGVDVVERAAARQRVDDRFMIATGLRAHERMRLAREGDADVLALDERVVDRDRAVLEEPTEGSVMVDERRPGGTPVLGTLATKRRWREADARMFVDAWRRSGQSIEAFAREVGTGAWRLRDWVSRLAGGIEVASGFAGDVQRFVPAVVAVG